MKNIVYIKSHMAFELEKYIKKFEKYDNELNVNIKEKEEEHKQKVEKFKEKWGEDVFPADQPIKDREEKEIKDEKKALEEEKNKITNELKDTENEFKAKLLNWKKSIDYYRNMAAYNGNEETKKINQESKNKLEEELKKQLDGIEMWEKNGVDPEDKLYKRRKEIIIPKLKKDIEYYDSILDDVALREDYKELGKLGKKIDAIKFHDRQHMIPELKDILGLNDREQEKIQAEEPMQEEIQKEETKQEKTQEEETKQEKTQAEEPKQEKTQAEEPKQEKTQAEDPKHEEIHIEDPKHEEIYVEEPEQDENDYQETNENKEQQPVQMIIGRKIKLKIADGKEISLANSKEYFKYMKSLNFAGHYLNTELINKLGINERDAIGLDVGNVNPIIIFSMLQGLENNLTTKNNVIDAIKSINANDKESLDKILPIKWDRKDLSKGAFLPWNIRNRNEMNEILLNDKHSNVMEIIGEYEPNPFKRLIKQTKKLLLTEKDKPEQLTEGRESISNKEKLSEREDIKVSEDYITLQLTIDNQVSEKEWKSRVNEYRESGRISESEANDLMQKYKERVTSNSSEQTRNSENEVTY